MSIGTSNPSRWGPKARRHAADSAIDLNAYVETHVGADRILEHEGQKVGNRTHWWSPAAASNAHTSEGGKQYANHGGVAQVAKATLGCTTMGASRGSEGFNSSIGIGDCWLAVDLAICKKAVFVAVYFDDSVGPRGVNLGRLREILEYARSRRRFLVMYGDMNMTPFEFEHGFFARSLGLTVVTPTNVDFTCTNGGNKMSTFYVVSDPLRPLVVS